MQTENAPFDDTAEMRAMILTALPFPPLPVQLRRLEDGNVLGEEVVQTTHDILSTLLREACARCTGNENMARRKLQQAVLGDFLRELVAAGRADMQDPPALYASYQKYSLLHIATYFPPGAPVPQVTVMPLGHVCRGDKTHRKMCDYMAGQAVLLELPHGRCAQDWMAREYADLLTICKERLVYNATPLPGSDPAHLQE